MEVEKGRQVRVQGGNTVKEHATDKVDAVGELSKQLRRTRSCFRPKKKRQPSSIGLGWRGHSQGLLCGNGIDFGASGADDLIGGAEDFLGALFGDRFRVKTVPSAQPILNIP